MIPLDLKEGFESIKAALVARGKEYAALKNAKYFEVSGIALKESSGPFDEEQSRHAMRMNPGKTYLIKISVGTQLSLRKSNYRGY